MKANKKMYPGGGMLRNKYNNGGPVSGYGMSNRQMQGALMSRPSQPTPKKVVSTAAKPAPATKPSAQSKPTPVKSSITPAPKTRTIGEVIGGAIRNNPKLMRMYGFQAMLGSSQPAEPAKATTTPFYKATPTTAPSKENYFIPASMAKRPTPATAKPASMANPLTLSGAPAYTRPAKPYLSSRGRPMSEKVAGAPKYKGVEVSLTSSKNPGLVRSLPTVNVTATAKPATAKPATAKPATAKPATATSTTTKPPVTAAMSFSRAFADARAKGLKEFTWQGKRYNTMLKGEAEAKPQATRNIEPVSRNIEPVSMMPSKVVTSITKPYFESPTGVMQPASVKTTEMRDAPMQKMPAIQATSAQQSQPKAIPTTDNKKTGYFKPGTMAEYLEERRRKMRGNLMTR